MDTRIAVVFIAVLALGLSACERAEPSVIGNWVAAEEGITWTVEIREDSTWSMVAGTLEAEGRYTATDDGQVRLHPTGSLAEVMPGGYQAEVQADTLRLCSVAGCTDMVRAIR
jgi:hypothetical protein